MQLEDQKMSNAILTALADPELLGIIDSTMYRAKSAWDIIIETRMPATTVYRKIKWLLHEKLLVVDKISLTPDGKKFSLFHSVFRSIFVRYENNKILIEKEPNIDPVERLTERFFTV